MLYFMKSNEYGVNIISDSNIVISSDYLFENDTKVLGYDMDNQNSDFSIQEGQCIKINEGRVCLKSFKHGSGSEQVNRDSPFFELFGILISVVFEANEPELYTNWIQTVIANLDQEDMKTIYDDNKIVLRNKQFIDGDIISPVYKFFYANEYKNEIDVKEFFDNPQRRKLRNRTIIWDAELSLMQFDKKKFNRLISFKYGFTLIDKKPMLVRRVKEAKSLTVLHINTMKSIPILEFLQQ